MSFVQLAAYGLALLVLYVLVRQRYFSVISDIPGPFLGTFGTCFQLWEIYKGHINEGLAQLHRRHGKANAHGRLPELLLMMMMRSRALCADQLQRSQRQPPGRCTSSRGAVVEIRLVPTFRRTE